MNVYDVITEVILEKLEQGVVPWHKPWNVEAGEPKNFITKKDYRGINVFLLGVQGYDSPYWLTFKQAKMLGGNIKAGAKGTPVIYWNWKEIVEDDGDIEKIPFIRYYTVFNANQIEGIEFPPLQANTIDFNPIAKCEGIVHSMKNAPAIEHGLNQACYRPRNDSIGMPSPNTFKTTEEYYSTLFHELTHSTGHQSRLNRSTLTDMCPFGSTSYAKEELVAEMGAAFLCGTAGIENTTVDNSAAYVAGWLKRLRNEKKLVIHAAAQAQKAADLILGRERSLEQTSNKGDAALIKMGLAA